MAIALRRLVWMVLVACIALDARAVPTIDQQQLDDAGTGLVVSDFPPVGEFGANGLDGAQTFTVGATGYLVRIDVPLWLSGVFGGTPGARLDFDLRPVTSDAPVDDDGLALATGSIDVEPLSTSPPTGTGEWTSLRFSPGLAVTPGEQLALALIANAGTRSTVDLVWDYSATDDPYAGGSLFVRGSNASNVPVILSWSPAESNPLRDHGFITYVDPAPEPGGATGELAAALCLLATRARSRVRSGG
ncbi:MAG TPA: hypothetical protein VMH82_13185 [Myxococcota bacterium]|nr:hypothetical protein [Myxococcota bacterium]